jgi:5-methylthioadenosine/S-adenosylhomocysteine deaminase
MKKIFKVDAIVTCNPQQEVIEDAFIAIDGDEILDLGPYKKRPRASSFKVEERPGCVMTPGLYNLHTHLAMVLLRGIAEDLNLQTWLFDYIFPAEKKWVDREFVKIGTELAVCESLLNGVVSVADMYFYQEEVGKILDKAGMLGVLGVSYFDHGAMDSKSLDQSLKHAVKLSNEYKKHDRIQVALAPHAPYTCSPETLRKTAQTAKDHKIPVMIHLSETEHEQKEIQAKYGKTPADYILEAGLAEAPYLLTAHSVWLSPSDIQKLNKKHVTAILNPQCNSKLSSGFAPITEMRDQGLRIALGTDGAASNNRLDILSEIQFLAKLYRLKTGDLEGFSGPDLFDCATIRAAEAIGWGDTRGSLEPGKKADFILFDFAKAHLTPLSDVYSHLIYTAQSTDVEDVYVNGQCLMKKRKIKVMNVDRVMNRARSFFHKMKSDLKMKPATRVA